MSPRTGRPKLDNPHAKVVSVRLTAQEYEQAVACAEAAGMALGPWMRARITSARKPRQ